MIGRHRPSRIARHGRANGSNGGKTTKACLKFPSRNGRGGVPSARPGKLRDTRLLWYGYKDMKTKTEAMLKIAKLGNPILRKISTPVDSREIKSSDIQRLIDDMLETMYDEPGIGLAAPQVSRSIQLVVMGCKGEGGFPETVLINPSIVYYGPEQVENWEGCLSVDGLRGKVTRPSLVRVKALDRKGKALDFEATGLYAVCIQHEVDHLLGKVFLDRMTDMSTLTQLDEFTQYWQKEPTNVI